MNFLLLGVGEEVDFVWIFGLFFIFVQTASLAALIHGRFSLGWTLSIIFSQLTIWLFKLAAAETLSVLNAFRPENLIILDFCLAVVLLLLAIRSKKFITLPKIPKLTKFDTLILLALISSLIIQLLNVIFLGQTNWDSQSYHLPRAMSWLQQGSLDYFPTPNERENVSQILPSVLYAFSLSYSPIGAALAINSFIALLLILLAVKNLVFVIAGNQSAALFATLFVASVPMLIVQASSTQTDLLASSSIALVISAIAKVRREKKSLLDFPSRLAISVSFAFAIASKATAVIALIPVLIMVPIFLKLDKVPSTVLKTAGLAGALTAITSGPYLFRLLGSWEISGAGTQVLSRDYSLNSILSGIVKNGATALQAPNADWIRIVFDAAMSMSRFLNLNLNVDGTNFTYTPVFEMYDPYTDSHLGFPIHILLSVTVLVLALYKYNKNKTPILLILTGFTQLLLLSIAVKWQPWIGRFQFPSSYLMAAGIAGISTLPKTFLRLTSLILISLMIASSAWLPYRSIFPTPNWNEAASITSWTAPSTSKDLVLQMGGGFENQIVSIRSSLSKIDLNDFGEVHLETGSNDPKFFVWALLFESGFNGKVINTSPGGSTFNSRTLVINLFPCQEQLEQVDNQSSNKFQNQGIKIYASCSP